MGNDACNSLMKQISDHMKTAFHGRHDAADLYYLGNGLFAAVSEAEDADYFRKAAQCFSASMQGGFQMGKLELEINPCLCVFRCPQDFD